MSLRRDFWYQAIWLKRFKILYIVKSSDLYHLQVSHQEVNILCKYAGLINNILCNSLKLGIFY